MNKRVVVELNKRGEYVVNLYFDNLLAEGATGYGCASLANEEAMKMAKMIAVKDISLINS